MKKQLTFLLFTLCVIKICDGQSYRPLAIGDAVPNIQVAHIYNYNKSNSTNLSAFKNKLVILVFWNTFCKSCIEGFPSLQKLKAEFKDQIEIVTVNSQSKKVIDSLFAEVHKFKSQYNYHWPSLPTVTSDRILHALFPHRLIPHVVWIGKDGRVKAFTDEDMVDRDHLREMMANPNVLWKQKNDLISVDPRKAIFPQVNFIDKKIKYYSGITSPIDGYEGTWTRLSIDSIENTVRISRPCFSIWGLCYNAVSKGLITPDQRDFREYPQFSFGKRVILNIRDSTRLIFQKESNISRQNWDLKNLYCYEGVFPLSQQDRIWDLMIEDISRYFNLKVRIEKRKMHCWALERIGNEKKFLEAKGFSDGLNPDVFNKLSYHIETRSFGFTPFTDRIASYHKDLIIVDNTGFSNPTQSIFLEGSAPLNDLQLLREELRKKYDLDIVEKDTDVDVMVIEEIK